MLREQGILFGLAGGIVADQYRGEPRATEDIDVLVAIGANEAARAAELVQSLGYAPVVVTKAMLEGDVRFRRKSSSSPAQIVVGRDRAKPYGVDLLLLSLPWAGVALERSQHNLIEVGGVGRVPCLTVEDLIISKLFAIKNSAERRFKKPDIPDIALMLEHNPDVDLNYLSDVMTMLELILPKGVEQEAAPLIARISRKMRRKNRTLDY